MAPGATILNIPGSSRSTEGLELLCQGHTDKNLSNYSIRRIAEYRWGFYTWLDARKTRFQNSHNCRRHPSVPDCHREFVLASGAPANRKCDPAPIDYRRGHQD